MKYEEKQLAIKLRKRGKSYNEILKKVRVSKGTLSLWLRGIKLTKKQEKELYVTRRQKNARLLADMKQEKKKRQIENINKAAKKQIFNLIKDRLFLAGLMLYWAEGDKSEQAELVKFSNSDPKMIEFMMKWFRKICKVEEQRFRIALHIHELHNEIYLKKYWSHLTNIPIKQFHKTQIKSTSIGHRKKMLYNGTCSIRISDKNLFRKIKNPRGKPRGILFSGVAMCQIG